MAATTTHPFLCLIFSNPPSVMDNQLNSQQPMFYSLFFFTFSLSILIFSLCKRLKRTEHPPSTSITPCHLSKIVENTQQTHDSNTTLMTHSLLLEILPSNSPKWATLFSDEVCQCDANGPGLERVDSGGDDCGKMKKNKKRRAKKKRLNSNSEGMEGLGVKEKQELVCLYPFTSSSSLTQRKIKQQYDQLVKSHQSNGLTLAQVGQFVNCLVEARNELKHKSEAIQRKFTITKALLFKADRSSFDRHHQQIYKLELEQKRLEEDAFVYNWLQQQLKLSPAYKKMLEIGANMALKAKSGELIESKDSKDAEFAEISFEELLAREKKDSFWLKNGKPRSCSG